jgi:hypothetical protein
MVRTLSLNHLKAEALSLLLAAAGLSVYAQQPGVEIALPGEAVNAFVDRPGDLYIQVRNERLLKYSKDGKLLGEFRPKEAPTVFEPRDGARMFAYYRKRNLAGFTGFGTEPVTTLHEEFAVEPWLACSAGDKGIWILDRADFSMKRVNLTSLKTEIEFTLPQEFQHDNIQMREYQGFLFLLVGQNRLVLFNGFGKRLKILTGQQLRFFNFIGEDLYYADNDTLHFYNLFDGTQRSEPADPSARFILLTDEARFVVYPGKVVITRFK